MNYRKITFLNSAQPPNFQGIKQTYFGVPILRLSPFKIETDIAWPMYERISAQVSAVLGIKYATIGSEKIISIESLKTPECFKSLGLNRVDPLSFDGYTPRTDKMDGYCSTIEKVVPLSIGRGILWDDRAVILAPDFPGQKPFLGMNVYSKGNGLSGWTTRLMEILYRRDAGSGYFISGCDSQK